MAVGPLEDGGTAAAWTERDRSGSGSWRREHRGLVGSAAVTPSPSDSVFPLRVLVVADVVISTIDVHVKLLHER